jgi:DNA helicase TIP49 (TBP-interacting protein)
VEKEEMTFEAIENKINDLNNEIATEKELINNHEKYKNKELKEIIKERIKEVEEIRVDNTDNMACGENSGYTNALEWVLEIIK